MPQIQKILVRSPDVASVLQWQKNVLDLQIAHLTNVRSRIEEVPADTWGTSSLAHLQIVLEAMNMSTEQKQDWLLERWSQAMIPVGAPSDWKVAFLQELKGFLPTEWDPEQTKAWTELQELPNDSKYRDELQQAVQPFWQIMQQRPVEPDEWAQSMGALVDSASAAYQKGLSAGSEQVQSIVDQWIGLYSKSLQLPVDDKFMERFSYYAEQVNRHPNRQLWDIMLRLNPDKLKLGSHAQELMLEGLRWRLGRSTS